MNGHMDNTMHPITAVISKHICKVIRIDVPMILKPFHRFPFIFFPLPSFIKNLLIFHKRILQFLQKKTFFAENK